MGALRNRMEDRAVDTVITFSRPLPTVIAVGAFLKNTVCLIHHNQGLVSRDNGNLETVEAVLGFEQSTDELLRIADDRPSVVAHDLHPNFHSSRYAEATAARLGVGSQAVQHHHAHVAAVMAEHDHRGPVLGLALDGFGLGENNQSWGGELLLVDEGGYRRLGHLRELGQPGGDKAAREPWRMGAAALHALGRNDEIAEHYRSLDGSEVIAAMLDRDVNCPLTSSCGRLFDAACGLLRVKPVASFEGEAPMALESMVERPRSDSDGWKLEGGVLDMMPLLDRLVDLETAEGANLFHGTLIAAMTEWVVWAAEITGVREVALCGGCFFQQGAHDGTVGQSAETKNTGLETAAAQPWRPRDQRRPGVGGGPAERIVEHVSCDTRAGDRTA